jgi:hypothetical protein
MASKMVPWRSDRRSTCRTGRRHGTVGEACADLVLVADSPGAGRGWPAVSGGKSNFKDNHLAGLNGELEGFQFEVRSGARSVMPTRRS